MLPSREEIIVPLVQGRRVLDCGGIDHYAAEEKLASGEWLHATIAQHAKQCIGVDILKENVDRINSVGRYRFVAGNVEDLPYIEEFDIVVAGEVVEHLYNMGRFLDSAWRALKSKGKLVITTPNAYGFSHQFRNLVLGNERVHPEHTCYYSAQTLKYIISRHGFEVDRVHFATRPAAALLTRGVRRAIERLRPSMAEKIVAVATKQPERKGYLNVW